MIKQLKIIILVIVLLLIPTISYGVSVSNTQGSAINAATGNAMSLSSFTRGRPIMRMGYISNQGLGTKNRL